MATDSSPDELVERVKAAAAAETANRHPGLDAHALGALAWNFTFAWR